MPLMRPRTDESLRESIGPRTVDSDRVNYSTAITESWKRQTLLNIVKLRYHDLPIFVDIGQIVSGYTLETALNASGVDLDSLNGSTTLSVGASGRFIDRPTITYVPLTGDSLLRGLITPIPPVSLFSAIEAGWAAVEIARFGMGAMNGIANERFQAGIHTPADPEFARLVELLGTSRMVARRRDSTAMSPRACERFASGRRRKGRVWITLRSTTATHGSISPTPISHRSAYSP